MGFGKSGQGQIVYDDVTITLSTLGAAAAIVAQSRIDAARLHGFRVLKTEYFIEATGKTSGEGPIMIGLAVDVTATGVKNAIESDPQSTGDEVGQAEALTPVWPLKMLPKAFTNGDIGEYVSMRSVNPGWSVPEGLGMQWWAFNMGASLTTGTVIRIFAKHFGVWLRD